MDSELKYSINLESKFGYLKHIDIPQLIEDCDEQWFNQTLCPINDCVARLGIIQGEFHWHKHDHEDEFFIVLQGQLHLDIEGGESVTLNQHCGYTVPRGVMHRPRAPERTVILMVEGAGVNPVGDD
ncbi:MAG: cupin domain-containing protein [Candidatus Zixiibacteriota bacterium]|nr:MAG: cupin domain-containing protein [candidate division Zixibacteria bacterium]